MTVATFTPLPQPLNARGAPRRIGVEIEMGGLTEAEVARLAARHLGGRALASGEAEWRVEGGVLGDLQVYLDTALRKSENPAVRATGVNLGREVIPVELVTEPLTLDGLEALQGLCGHLREAGAKGSAAGLMFGFGVHLNVEIAAADSGGVTRPLLAYALIEDWLRADRPIDLSRRLLPFANPYPTRLVLALLDLGPEAGLSEVADAYLQAAASRNYGLDMLPIIAKFFPDKIRRAFGNDAGIGARPAFHFRLPDCRIDEPDWTLSGEWQSWVDVERVADDGRLLRSLADSWRAAHRGVTLMRADWAGRAGRIVAPALKKTAP